MLFIVSLLLRKIFLANQGSTMGTVPAVWHYRLQDTHAVGNNYYVKVEPLVFLDVSYPNS